MESEARKINVRIGGMSYNLVSGESEQYTRQIATRADEMIRRVTMQSPQLSQQMTTILALVNAVDELSRQAAQLGLAEQQREATELKNAELRVELAKVRELNWEMKKEILRLTGLVREQPRQPEIRMETRAVPVTLPPAASFAAAPAALPAAAPAASSASSAYSADATDAADAADAATPSVADQQLPALPSADAPGMPAAAVTSLPDGPAERPAAVPAMQAEPVVLPVADDIADGPADEIVPPVAKPAQILPPLGVRRNHSSHSRPAGAPLKNWLPNPWADAGEPEAGPGSLPAGPSSEIQADAPSVFVDAPAPSDLAPSGPKSPRLLHEMRQTGLDEYLSQYGQGRSVVTDLTNDDEP